MAVKYQVFISSTYEDLKEERERVTKAVLEMGHIPVGMEMFSAADEEQWRIITRHIDESDYYAVLLAHRCGSLTGGISYTRKEYEYAASMHIPILGFVLDDSASWPTDRVDLAEDKVALLSDFKALVRSKPIDTWSTADDLHGKFAVALMKTITAQPREGWLRSNSASASPQMTAELTRLSAENASLRGELESERAGQQKSHSENLSDVRARLKANRSVMSYRRTSDPEWIVGKDHTLWYYFQVVATNMQTQTDVPALAIILALYVRHDRKESVRSVAHNQVRELLAKFRSLKLVEPTGIDLWVLSNSGQDLLDLYMLSTLSPPESDNRADDSKSQSPSRPEEDESS